MTNSNQPQEITASLLDEWATDPKGPVALTLKQLLASVETDGKTPGIIYPPTYADIGYNIDELKDGTRVALIDSVGSQANRMEPIFKASSNGEPENPLAALVPQLNIVLQPKAKKSTEEADQYRERRSIFDLAHRIADAVVHSCPKLKPVVDKAFTALQQHGNAGPLCSLAPTSLVFGVWDSRNSQEKRPRIVRSIIRAWDVEVLHAAAQFNSVWKALDEDQQQELKKDAKAKKTKLSVKGFADAPATFRTTKIQEYKNGEPNPEARVLGGVLVKDRIERTMTVNLVALRGLRGKDDAETNLLRKYLLGLSLLAATTDMELFLREGCHLRYEGEDVWYAVPRRGEPSQIGLNANGVQNLLLDYTSKAADHFKKRWPGESEYEFDLKEAKKLLAKKDDDAAEE